MSDDAPPDRPPVPAAGPASSPASGAGAGATLGGWGFLDTLRHGVISGVPALSAVVFVIVAVKVFRAAGMETTTTVAVVSTADVVALLKGVVLTLLPGFLTGLTAVSMWWWADALHACVGPGEARPQVRAAAVRALISPQAALAWAFLVMAFFTVSWTVLLVLLVPMAWATVALLSDIRGQGPLQLRTAQAGRWLKGLGLGATVVTIGYLTLAPTVWLPLRTVTVRPGHTVTLAGRQLPQQFAAYVLKQDEAGVSLLLATPRAVVQVDPADVEPAMPLCVTPEAPTRQFYLRASQVLGIDADNHSPYGLCPELDAQTIFGN